MFKRSIALFMIGVFMLFTAGCQTIAGLALAAGAAYGMSKIWTH